MPSTNAQGSFVMGEELLLFPTFRHEAGGRAPAWLNTSVNTTGIRLLCLEVLSRSGVAGLAVN